MTDVVAAIDWGGTKLKAGLIDAATGHVLASAEARTPRGLDATVSVAIDLLQRAAEGSVARGVGVCVPGMVARDDRTLMRAPVQGLADVPVATILEDRLGMATTIHNDADAAATAEWRFGAARGHDTFIWVTVSTGVGAGIYTDGRLLRGARGFAAELGHLPVCGSDARCACGRVGCVQAVASGPALARRAQRLGLVAPDGRTVALLAARGDVAAGQVLRRAADALGQGLAMAALVIDPSIVVVGGGVAPSLDLEVVAEAIASRGMSPVPLRRTSLDGNAPLIGCAVAHLEATA